MHWTAGVSSVITLRSYFENKHFLLPAWFRLMLLIIHPWLLKEQRPVDDKHRST